MSHIIASFTVEQLHIINHQSKALKDGPLSFFSFTDRLETHISYEKIVILCNMGYGTFK